MAFLAQDAKKKLMGHGFALIYTGKKAKGKNPEFPYLFLDLRMNSLLIIVL